MPGLEGLRTASRRQLVILGSGLILAVGLALAAFSAADAVELPSALLWTTLAGLVSGALAVALSYAALLAERGDGTLHGAACATYALQAWMVCLGAQHVMQVSDTESLEALAAAGCAGLGEGAEPGCAATAAAAFSAHGALAAKGGLGLAAVLLSWGCVQGYVQDRRAQSADEAAHRPARCLGGFLGLLAIAAGIGCVALSVRFALTTMGGAAMRGLRDEMAFEPLALCSVWGVALLGLASSVMGAVGCCHSRARWGGSWSADAPRWLAAVWLVLASVLTSWSSSPGSDAMDLFAARFDDYAAAYPDVVAEYCADTGGSGGEVDCLGRSFFTAQQLSPFRGVWILSAASVLEIASACLRRAVRVHPLTTPGPAVELEMGAGARAAEYDGGNAELGMRGSTVGLVDATLDQSER